VRDSLTDLNSTIRVSEAEVTAPEVVGQEELYLVEASFSDWSGYEEVW
jgi:hypothetical protein